MITRKMYDRMECSKQQYYSQFVNDDILKIVEKYYVPLIKSKDYASINFYIRARVEEILLVKAGEGWSTKTGCDIAEAAMNQIDERSNYEY